MRYRILVGFLAATLAIGLFAGCEQAPQSVLAKVIKQHLDSDKAAKLLATESLQSKLGAKGRIELTQPGDAFWKLLDGQNEEVLAKQLESGGIKFIAMPTSLTRKEAKKGNLFERILKNGELNYLSTIYKDSNTVLVGLTAKAFRLSDQDLSTILDYTRKGILGNKDKSPLPMGFAEELKFESIVDLRITDSRGFNKTLGVIRGRGKSVAESLDKAIERARSRYEKNGSGGPTTEPIGTFMGTARISLSLYRERGRLDISRSRMYDNIAPGLDGVVLTFADAPTKPIIAPPLLAKIYKSRKADEFLDEACKRGKRKKEDWKTVGTTIEVFRTVDFTEEKPAGKAVRLFRGVEYVDPKYFGIPEVQQSFFDGADWLVFIFDMDSGKFKYEYYATKDRWRTNSYNIIRHCLATLTMIQAYEISKDEKYLKVAKRAIEWVLDLVEWEGKMAIFHHPRYDKSYKLGGAGCVLQCMTEYFRFERVPEWEKSMKGIAEFIIYMNKDNGHYRSFYNKPGTKENDREVTIYPGEANLALVRMYHLFEDQRYLDTLEKAFKYYSKWFNDNKKPNRKGSQAAFVPWDMSAMMEYYEIVKRDEIATYAYQMADWIIDNWFINNMDDTYWKDNVGGFHSAQRKWDIPIWNSGVYGEGIISVFRLAKMRNDAKQIAKYRNVGYKVMRFTRNLQYRAVSGYYLPNIDSAVGAIPSEFNKDDCRLDYAYHNLTVNYRALRFFEDSDWKALGVEPLSQANKEDATKEDTEAK